ncbi:MAG: hypothetical protein Q4P06_08745 [Actinomycetaceae bacterium]|nr:hypothetical protein [Actinomycetaceae bacterium]
MAKKKKPAIAAHAEDGSPVVEIFAFEYEDGNLVMDCKALGSMRMDVIITPADITNGWPVLKRDWKVLLKFAKAIPGAIRKHKPDKNASKTD